MKQIQILFGTETYYVAQFISPFREGIQSIMPYQVVQKDKLKKKFLYSKLQFKKGERFLTFQHAYLQRISFVLLCFNFK